MFHADYAIIRSLIARFVGPTWGPTGADRTQVGPLLALWTLLSGVGMLTLIFNILRLSDAYIYWLTGSTLVKVMVCHLYDIKPLPEPVLTYCHLDPNRLNRFSEIWNTIENFLLEKKIIWKCCLSNGGHFVLASMCWSIAIKPVGSIYRSVSHIGYQWHC